ncbi:MAG TPA: hypothetical protein VMB53_02730 [Gaiellaceae bacterium]|nr:hypothetical protein [Gaiellaceae bacterium]
MLRDQLQPDAAACLVDLLHDDVDDVAARHHVLDVADATRADVRDVEETVGPLLQLDERAELRRLDDLAGVGVPHLRLLRQRLDRGDRGLGLRAVGRVDEDRAVLLDVDLHLVVRLEAADRLAALADHEADLLLVDLDRRDARRVRGELRPRLRDHPEHLVEDEVPRPLRLLERVAHDLLRDARDLDVHLERGDALTGPGDLEVHVAQVVLRALDVGQDDVVVALLHEAHRDPAHRRLDRHAGVHQRERRAAHRAHRRRAVRLERLRDETDRVRELVRPRHDGLERALRERPVADVAPLRAAHEARLPDRVRREVVVVHVAALLLEGEVVDALTLLRGAERERGEDLRLAALEQAGAVGARIDADLDLDRADLLGAAPVGAALLDGDLLPDDVLVDRLARLLHVRARRRVLRGRQRLAGLRVDRCLADRERQLDLLGDLLEQEVPLRRLQLLRVLLRVGEGAQVVAELLPHRALDGDRALLLEQRLEPRADLQLPGDVLVGRVHRERRRELREELVDDRARVLQADGLDQLPDPVAVRRLELGVQLGVEPLRLAGLAAQVLLRLAELHDLAVCELERLEDLALRDLVGACLDHRQRLGGADDDQVERRLLELLERRVDDEPVLAAADAHGADRAEERQRRDHQRGRCAVDAQDVVRGDEVGREHGADDLHLVLEALRPQRPDRAVDHARREDRPLRGAPLALEEAARDLAGGVHPLLDVDRQGEEVGVLPRFGAALGGGEHHRLAGTDDDGAVRLLRELAGLEADLLCPYLDGDLRPALGRDTHSIVLHSALGVEGGSLSQALAAGLAQTSALHGRRS